MPEEATTIERSTVLFDGDEVEVVWRKVRSITESQGKFPPLEPGVYVADGIQVERDVAVPLRDGTVIYVDVYRPDGAAPVPAIVAWSPYGKRAGFVGMADARGVPPGTYSEATKFEGPDPAYWCRYGYAVVNPDARGAGNSEGDVRMWSTGEGRDCHDLIEWIAQQEWCNDKVGMAGSSWLAISQWFAAAEHPAHLACIAPWEGLTDCYRDLACRGGIPEIGFIGSLIERMHGPGRVDDVVAMSREYPTINAYWEDKIADLDKIEVPAYITAGWSHFHLHGAIEAFRRISSSKKWLRVHREFEWPDFYTPENMDDLRRFFDRYLKGLHNGWELTPRIRLDVMDAGEDDHRIRRAEKAFPLDRTQYRQLFLHAGAGRLTTDPVPYETSVRYEAGQGVATFDLRFEEGTELTGYMKLHLWVEADGADDMDLFVTVQKLDEEGTPRPTLVLGQPHPGASGMLRVSHRELDEQRSTQSEPFHTHRREQRLRTGEVVPIDIGIWPTSRYWHAGEQLRVMVSGHYVREPGWFEHFAWDLRNHGQHIIHTGGRYESFLLVPVIPPRSPVVVDPVPLMLASIR